MIHINSKHIFRLQLAFRIYLHNIIPRICTLFRENTPLAFQQDVSGLMVKKRWESPQENFKSFTASHFPLFQYNKSSLSTACSTEVFT